MIYGYVYGIARRFLTSTGHHFTVRYDTTAKRQDEGGSQTIIHLTWE